MPSSWSYPALRFGMGLLLLGCAPQAFASASGIPVQPAPAGGQTGQPAQKITPAKATKDSKKKKKKKALAESTQKMEHITVVGSRLIHNSIDEIQPVTTVSGKQIQRRGYTNAGTALLTENPSFTVGANTPNGSQGLQAGQTFLNLFNMGSERTLTLVNGRRFVSGASASIYGSVSGDSVDVTEIPDGLIERVDTSATGGSPVYGADAIAGTVNFKLKNNVEGLHIDGQAGWNQKGGGGVQDKIEFLGGHNFDHDRGNITLDAEYTKQYGMAANSRYWSGQDSPWYMTVAGKPYQNALATNYRMLGYTTAGIPLTSDQLPFQGGNLAGITNAAGQTLTMSPNGKSLIPLTYNKVDSYGYNAQGGNGFPASAYNNLETNTGRVSLVGLAHYDITDHVTAYGEGWYERYNSTNVIGSPYTNTSQYAAAGQPTGNLILNTSNPFLTNEERTTITNALSAAGQPTNQFYYTRASTDYYSGRYTTANELYRFVGGFKGDFNLFGRKVYWDANANYGSNSSRTDQNQINNQNYYNALNATTNAAGQIVCSPGYTNSPMPTYSSSCAPLNVFGVNQASKGAIDYITSPSRLSTHNTQLDINITAHTNIVKLPAGALTFLIGYEHRREGFNFTPDAFMQGRMVDGSCAEQYGYATCTPSTKGSYGTHEAFAETHIPVVSPRMGIPGVYNLSFDSSARFTYNNRTGSFWSYTGGGSYSPTQDITFRSNYTRSLRAPGMAELFAPLTTDYESGEDPCDTNYINGGPNPAIRAANCGKAGIKKGFLSNISNYTVTGRAGGNRHLQNEVGTSISAGGIFSPRFIPGLTIQGDYIDIRLDKAINSPGVQNILDACYDSPQYPNNAYCNLFQRDSSGQISGFTDSYQNIGSIRTRVAQLSLAYRLPLQRVGLPASAGQVSLQATELHYISSKQTIGGSTQQIYGGTTTPKDNMTMNFNYDRGPLSFQWQTQWYGPSRLDVNQPLSVYQFPGTGQFFMFNTNISYQFMDKYTVFFNVANISNAHPPFPYQGSTNRYFQAILGRSFLMGFHADVF